MCRGGYMSVGLLLALALIFTPVSSSFLSAVFSRAWVF